MTPNVVDAAAEPTVNRVADMPTLMLPATLLAVFCLSPFGVLAMIASRQTAIYLRQGDEARSLASFYRTRKLLRYGSITAVFCAGLVIVAQILLTL